MNKKTGYPLLLGTLTFLALSEMANISGVRAGEARSLSQDLEKFSSQSDAIANPYTPTVSQVKEVEYFGAAKSNNVNVRVENVKSFVAKGLAGTSNRAQDLFGTQAQSAPTPAPPPSERVYFDRAGALAVPERGFYISITPGFLFGYDIDITSPTLTGGKIKTDTGFSVSGALGYKLRNFRFEGEFSYNKNDADEVVFDNGTRRSLGGDFVTYTYTINGYYDFPLTSRFRPYIGGGLGFANFYANDVFVYEANRLRTSDTLFAFQVKAGLGYQLTDNVTVFAGYRLLGLDSQEYRSATSRVEGDSFITHSLQIGGRVVF